MHILDLIMYFVLAALLWYAIDKFSDGEFTEELGALMGLIIEIVFGIVYVVLFCVYPDWNWIDILQSKPSLPNIVW